MKPEDAANVSNDEPVEDQQAVANEEVATPTNESELPCEAGCDEDPRPFADKIRDLMLAAESKLCAESRKAEKVDEAIAIVASVIEYKVKDKTLLSSIERLVRYIRNEPERNLVARGNFHTAVAQFISSMPVAARDLIVEQIAPGFTGSDGEKATLIANQLYSQNS